MNKDLGYEYRCLGKQTERVHIAERYVMLPVRRSAEWSVKENCCLSSSFRTHWN